MRCLVTGAAGFIGANLVRTLLDLGHEVRGIVSPQSDTWRVSELNERMPLLRVDLLDHGAVRETLRLSSPDWVFHLAAYGAYSFQTDWMRMIETNLAATLNLLEASDEVGCLGFINSGSSSEYGLVNHAPREEECCRPNSMYAITKLAGTQLCQRIAEQKRIRTLTLRLYSVYGPYEDPRRLMPSLVQGLLHGDYPPLADPRTARDFVYVDDVADAFVAALSNTGWQSGDILNIGSGAQTTLAELAEVAGKVFEVKQSPSWETYEGRSWDTRTWVSAPARAREVLDWTAQTSLEEGLRKLAAWLMANRDRLAPRYEKRQGGID